VNSNLEKTYFADVLVATLHPVSLPMLCCPLLTKLMKSTLITLQRGVKHDSFHFIKLSCGTNFFHSLDANARHLNLLEKWEIRFPQHVFSAG
jgi:hypothetical protein